VEEYSRNVSALLTIGHSSPPGHTRRFKPILYFTPQRLRIVGQKTTFDPPKSKLAHSLDAFGPPLFNKTIFSCLQGKAGKGDGFGVYNF
jgi:hypothetical protein